MVVGYSLEHPGFKKIQIPHVVGKPVLEKTLTAVKLLLSDGVGG